MKKVTIGRSVHRPEMIPIMAELIRGHDAVFLEEPPATCFQQLLAARSIIYSKIIAKEEITGDLSSFPHLRGESACIRTTRQLDLQDCRELFPLIRRVNTSEARRAVANI